MLCAARKQNNLVGVAVDVTGNTRCDVITVTWHERKHRWWRTVAARQCNCQHYPQHWCRRSL